jgi:proteasome alpha subunit
VEIVVAEVGAKPSDDQIYRITFDGSVTDEPGFVAFGGQADQVSAALKERYADGMSLSEAFAAALAALSVPGNGEYTAAQLEVAILDRTRDHRTFRRIRGARLEELLAQSRPAAESSDGDGGEDSGPSGSGDAPASSEGSAPAPPASGSAPPASGSAPPRPADSGPPTGPTPGSSDRGSGLSGGSPL